MRQLVLFLEERSAKVAFEGLLPRLLPNDVTLRYRHFIAGVSKALANAC